MYRTIVLTAGEPTGAQVDALKVAAAVDSTEELLTAKLTAWLKEGMLLVGAQHGTDLLAATKECRCTAPTGDAVRVVSLEGNVSEVVSVTDGNGGDIPYSREGGIVYPEGRFAEVVVTYRTKVYPEDAARYQSLAERYAIARYDGESEDVARAAVIGECYAW